MLLNHSGVKWEDRRIQLKDWNTPGEESEALKNQYPNRQMPCLELPDGQKFGQGNAMLRFLGKRHGYYPTDPMEAYKCEELIDVYRDLVDRIQSWYPMFQKNHEKMNADLLGIAIPKFLDYIEPVCGKHKFLVSDNLTTADFFIGSMYTNYFANPK